MSSAWETFLSATVILASSAPIKQRLTEAYTKHLVKMSYTDLPLDVRDDYLALEQSLSAIKPMRGETAVQATVRKMSDHDAGRYAKEIVNLFGRLSRAQQSMLLQGRPPVLRAVASGEELVSRV